MIKKNMQMYIRRKWLTKLKDMYAEAKRVNQWGRGFRKRWPAHPVAVDVSLFVRVEETWRYRMCCCFFALILEMFVYCSC